MLSRRLFALDAVMRRASPLLPTTRAPPGRASTRRAAWVDLTAIETGHVYD